MGDRLAACDRTDPGALRATEAEAARAALRALPGEVQANSSLDEFSQGRREIGPCRTLKERFFSGQAVSREDRGVRQVLFAPGNILRDREIVDFQALPLDSSRV